MDTHFLFSICDEKWKMKLGIHFSFFIVNGKWVSIFHFFSFSISDGKLK